MSRLFPCGVILCWLLSMGWLISTKIVPLSLEGPPPDQRILGPGTEEATTLMRWRIRWNDQDIGSARTESQRVPRGRGMVLSEVRLRDIPVAAIARDLFGPLSAVVGVTAEKEADVRVSLLAATEMHFDPRGMLERFSSAVRIDGLGELFRLEGAVGDRRLRLIVRAGKDLPAAGVVTSPVLYSHEYEIDPEVTIADSLSPQPRLANLHVGQTWTFPTFRPFPPHQTMRLVQARVLRQEVMVWDADVEPLFVVAFSELGGSGLTAAAEPFSHLWVREDGTVVLQRVKLANMQLEFRRTTSLQYSEPEPL